MANNNQIYKMSNAGGFKSLNRYYDMLAGNTTWQPWEPQGAYDALSTVTVPSGGLASIEFAGIPQGYKHLQIRGIMQTNRTTYTTDNGYLFVGNGSIDTAANYSKHNLYSDYLNGSAVISDASANATSGNNIFTTTSVTGAYGSFIVDFLDYSNISKYKTIRALSGADANGTVASYNPSVGLSSASWRSNQGITNIRFVPLTGTLFTQNCQFTLYGVR